MAFGGGIVAKQSDTLNYYSFKIESGAGILIKNYPDFPQLKKATQTSASFIFESKKENKLKFETEIGMGFAYFTKFYNIQNNIENLIIGSSVTNTTRFAFRVKYELTPKLNIGSGICFSHFSNGHYQLPNIGANIVQANFFYLTYLMEK